LRGPMENFNISNKLNELDSFFESRISICISDSSFRKKINDLFRLNRFINYRSFDNPDEFLNMTVARKNDLLLIDLRPMPGDRVTQYLENIRKNDADTAIITINNSDLEIKTVLGIGIYSNIVLPLSDDDLMKAAKMALGAKASHDIGMQFFDALFGMQMCTHRDLHQRTFDHVIRTTKVYSKFLLYLYSKGIIDLTSWVLKNCIMASLLHDIGKLLVMHGVLYKEGKLSSYEYIQVKQHPWHSITALLGGQDISFFANMDEPLETVSGYKNKNLSHQAQTWILKIMGKDFTALRDIDCFFSDMAMKPTIHSLNKDLLYIIFRHHDGVKTPYYEDNERNQFAKVISRKISRELSEESYLDIVTNALAICDMYDALMDTKRDYRKSPYDQFYSLLLLYIEMKKDNFFPFLIEEFIKFIVEYNDTDGEDILGGPVGSGSVFKCIGKIYEIFHIDRDHEWNFFLYISQKKKELREYIVNYDDKILHSLYDEWQVVFRNSQKIMFEGFIGELKQHNLLNKPFEELNDEEYRIFKLLYDFYLSYSSPYKQKMFLKYLKSSTIDRAIDSRVKERMIKVIRDEKADTIKEIEEIFYNCCFNRNNLFEVFGGYDENTLIIELNDFIRRSDT
jgi:hypothetical protein